MRNISKNDWISQFHRFSIACQEWAWFWNSNLTKILVYGFMMIILKFCGIALPWEIVLTMIKVGSQK